MKITKYNQACLLVESKGIRILVDPGNIEYTDKMVDEEWIDIDIILVTHKHSDHYHEEAINKIIERDKCLLYTSNEVVDAYMLDQYIIVKEGGKFEYSNIEFEVTKAVHGFLNPMKESNNVIRENIGFIIDDGEKRLYVTSDTINFINNYKCDVLCMPFNGNGLTLGIIDGIDFIKNINPELVLPIHLQHPNPVMNPDLKQLKKSLEAENINYKILEIGETIEI